MTEEELQMMNTIHLLGTIFSLDDSAEKALMDCIDAILKDEKGKLGFPAHCHKTTE